MNKRKKNTGKGKRVNIALDREIHQRAKVISVLKDISLNQYLEEKIAASVKKDLNRIKGKTGVLQ